MAAHKIELMSSLCSATTNSFDVNDKFRQLTDNKLGSILKSAGSGDFNCMKLAHYLPIYQDLFSALSGNIKMLEIGVQHGGSYRLWSNYFGPDLLNWTGIDINEKCLKLNDLYDSSKCKVFHGSQDDSSFLKKVSADRGQFDVIIDDGSHCTDHIIKSFVELSGSLKSGGLYIVEDVHACYWEGFRGSGPYLNVISYFQSLLHSLNSQALHHSRCASDIQAYEKVNSFSPIRKIEFLPSMIICHMGPQEPLIEWKAGLNSIIK